MAATNPFRVSDLVAKYGWKVMPYLSNLGRTLLAEAQVLFVDSGHTNALDADDGEHGHSFEKPLATIDYAVGLCTASEGSIILAAPGHAETQATAATCITADIAGISIICLGEGTLRPTITLSTDTGAVALAVTAANVTVCNLRVLVSMNAVVKAISVTASDCKLIDVEVQDNAAATEAAIGVLTNASADRLYIERYKHNGFLSGDACTEAISLIGVDRALIKDSWFRGKFSTAAVNFASTACNGIVVQNCIFENGTTALSADVVDTVTGSKWSVVKCWDVVGGYFFSGGSGSALAADDVSSVTAALAGSTVLGGIQLDHLAQTASAGSNYPTEITTNTILGMIMSDNGNPDQFNKANHSLKAIRDAVDGIGAPTDVTGAVGTSPTARSLQDILEKDSSGNFDDATDSLEAISDFVRTGTSLGAGIQLDHLQGTTTGVNADGDLSTYAVTKSLMAHIMSKTATTSTYQCSTDSLEAIGDAVSGFSSAVSQTPTARSLHDILEKDTAGNFDKTTDSLEAIADRLIDANVDKLTSAADGTGNYPASVVQDSVIAMMLSKSANPVATSYDNQTDSLEAISDALSAAIGSPSAGSALDILKKLYYTADGTGAYPSTVADDSTIAKIMASDNPATAASYNNETDSLEAIRDHLDGSTVLGGLNLDHLAKTAVASGADMTTEIADGTILSNILTSDGDTSGYDRTTDSLEAISDKVGTITNTGGTATIGAILGDFSNVTLVTKLANLQADADQWGTLANTGGTAELGAILGDFNNVTLVTKLANLQTDADRWGTLANTGGTAELGAMLGDFANSTLVTRLNTITTDGTYQEKCVEKVATSTDDDLFDVTGEVIITNFVGIVTTTAIGAAQNRIKIGLDATNLYDFDFSTEVDTNGDAVGTRYVFSAANPAVLTPLSNGAAGSGQPMWPWICPAGVIEQFKNAGDGGTTGQINWYCTYRPLSSDGAVAAAA